MRIVTFTTFLLASSALYPVFAQDNAKPLSSTQENTIDQSRPDNRAVDRDWKVKPSDNQQTEGKAGGKSPDNADHYDQKVDRDWRAEPRGNDKNPK